MSDLQTARPQLRQWHEIQITSLPAKYWDRLPKRMRTCYVQEIRQSQTRPGSYETRVACTPQGLATARPLYLTEEEATDLIQKISDPVETTRELRTAPAYFLPYDLQQLGSGPSHNLLAAMPAVTTPNKSDKRCASEAATDPEAPIPETLFDIFYFYDVGLRSSDGLHLVYASFLPGRLNEHQSGTIYTFWLREDLIEQAAVWTSDLDHLDSYERSLHVNRVVIENGATPPQLVPDAAESVAMTREELEEHYSFIPIKDPIFLRKEDIAEAENDPEKVLEQAQQSITWQQEYLTNFIAQQQQTCQDISHTPQQRQSALQALLEAQQAFERLECVKTWLEEAEIWYSSQPSKKRQPIFCFAPANTSCGLPSTLLPHTHHRKKGGKRALPTGYLLVVGLPSTLPLPWMHLKDQFHLPKEVIA